MAVRNRRRRVRVVMLARLARKWQKGVNDVTCPAEGLDDSTQCMGGGRCRKRYAEASLDKGKISKLKWAMVEQLGKHSDWDPVEQEGNPVATPLARGYLADA